MDKEGKLIWITGLAGAGKTTTAKNIYSILKQQEDNVVHLDGDDIRKMLGELGSFSDEGREKTAKVYSRMCNYLTERGISVIMSTICLYRDIHSYNRLNNKYYYEILLEVDLDVLVSRNKKGLYSSGIKNVMGRDIEAEFPKNPDLVLINNKAVDLETNIKKIIELITREG